LIGLFFDLPHGIYPEKVTFAGETASKRKYLFITGSKAELFNLKSQP
jgi:hypothetical protein